MAGRALPRHQQSRSSQPRPMLLSLLVLGFQGVGTFVLPLVVGTGAALLFDSAEVVETADGMLAFTLLVLLPVALAQVLGTVAKSAREVRYWREQQALDLRRLLDVLATHISVVTPRGWAILVSGLFFVLLAFSFKWASLGTMAVLSLFLFYLVTGWTLFVSAFVVRTFHVGLEQKRAGVSRQCRPAVVRQGEPVEEVFTFRRTPVPWGYVLLVSDPNPVRLRTESRYAVGSWASSREVEAQGRLRHTPRGHFRLGPARIWYQDVLGITRVSVASVASTELKVLPRVEPVRIIEPPQTRTQTPDILTRPHRFATEDHFRFREYAPGDDTRRIHWRLSMKSGRLQVRLPEAREISTQDVLLVLDNYLPPGKLLDAAHGADDILDTLVAAWLGIARELVNRGDRVTLMAAASTSPDGPVAPEVIQCQSGQVPRWQDLGARIRWQGAYDLPELVGEKGGGLHAVVVTARFTAPPPVTLADQSLTWLFLDPADALGPREPHWILSLTGDGELLGVLNWLVRLPHPVGSDENAPLARLRHGWRISARWAARRALRESAQARAARILEQMCARGDAVYRVERGVGHIRVVGLQGQLSNRKAS